MNGPQDVRRKARFRISIGLLIVGYLAVLAFFLLTEHKAHAMLGFLFWVLLVGFAILVLYTHKRFDMRANGENDETGQGGKK